LRTYGSETVPAPPSVIFGDAGPDELDEGVDAEVVFLCLEPTTPPTTPPTPAATSMITRMFARMIQNNCRRSPHILFSLALGALDASAVDAAELRLRAKSLASASAIDAFSASTYFSVMSPARVSN